MKFLLYPISVLYSIYSSFRNLLFDFGLIHSIEYKIPTIGIGASNNCDGQILVFDDLIGLNPINVRFIKKYTNIRKEISKAVSTYAREVRSKKFPLKKHSY